MPRHDTCTRSLAAASLVLSAIGCLPYTVGATAQTVAPGDTKQISTWYMIPNAVSLLGDSVSGSLVGADMQWRTGIAQGVDVGVRIPSFSGVIVDAKRRLVGSDDPDDAAVAIQAGLGMVNWGGHGIVELSILASGNSWGGSATPYGGLRAMQVIPLSRGAVHDAPSLGGFLGLRLGSADRGVSPELGVYHDPSALDLRSSRVIFVPSVSLYGDPIGRLFGFGR